MITHDDTEDDTNNTTNTTNANINTYNIQSFLYTYLFIDPEVQRELRGSQGMGVASSNWFDRVLHNFFTLFKPSCRPMFKPPFLGSLVPCPGPKSHPRGGEIPKGMPTTISSSRDLGTPPSFPEERCRGTRAWAA